MAPKPPAEHVQKSKEISSPVKRMAPKAPEGKKEVPPAAIASPSKRRAPTAPSSNNLKKEQDRKDEMERKDRQRKAEERYQKIIKERKEAQEEVCLLSSFVLFKEFS